MNRGRWWVLGALAVALLTFGLDATILNVALPTLATDLHATTGQLQWFANAYTLVLAAGLVPAGLLGDRFGPKPLLIGGLALFGVASVACAYADDATTLIAARAVLGVGAAFMVPLSNSVLTKLFPAGERARAIAVLTMAMALGIPLGPVLGGWMLDTFWWGSVFLINAPFVVIGIAALAWLLPTIPGRRDQRIDFLGILLSSAGLVGLTYGLIEAGDKGWGSAQVLVPALGGVALLAALVLWLRRSARPLFDLALFRSRGFAWGSVMATLGSFAMMGAMFVLVQYFQAVNGSDSLHTGLKLLPIVGGLLVGAQVADRLRPALGAKILVAIGFLLMAVSLVVATWTSVDTGYGFVAVWVTGIGVGIGFALPPSMDLAMGSLDKDRTGVGSGLLQALRQVGGTFGVAILGTVLISGYRAGLNVPGPATDSAAAGVQIAHATGQPWLLDAVRNAFMSGMVDMLWVCVGFAVLGGVLTLMFLPRRPADVEQSESEHDYVVAG
ncbi:MFS transporter [Actinocrispum wychmicini]|uniref:EmrB/QacA subfamily drug resistance transporter n=1 Tax=Actinocrispum wychmicini TaxID=1213861 RepID=A0A4R2K750_9PSEU|nr:MFS transporter [Actinocrispum wychmicini]TCO65658.1 EmrB/QacA subfamily drug resistance transporter [Actinocrispum wychmicini]